METATGIWSLSSPVSAFFRLTATLSGGKRTSACKRGTEAAVGIKLSLRKDGVAKRR